MLVDTHFHLPHEKYEKSPAQIISDAKKEGIEKFITIGTSISDSKETLEVIKDFPDVFATIGIYPHEDPSLTVDQMYAKLSELYAKNHTKIVGIGECGFDLVSSAEGGLRQGAPVELQREIFKMQVGFAIQHDLPIVLHNRNGNEHVLEVLSHFPKENLRGVCHSFTQDWDYAKKMLDLNFYISFSGMVTFKNVTPSVLEVAQKVPYDKYLLETDAPYLAPHPHRGKINYPEYVKIIAYRVAQLRETSFDEVSTQTYSNSCRLFKI